MSAGCSSTTTCKGAMHEGQNMGSPAVDGHGILHMPLSLASPLLLPLFLLDARTRRLPSSLAVLLMALFLLPTSPPVSPFLLGAWTRLLPYCLATLMMAFFLLLTFPPVFLLILASGDQDLALVLGSASAGFCYTCISCVAIDSLGASPFLFSSSLSPAAYTFTSAASALKSLPISSPLPSSLPSLLASIHSLFLHLHQVVQCDFGHVCLCVCVCVCVCACVCGLCGYVYVRVCVIVDMNISSPCPSTLG